MDLGSIKGMDVAKLARLAIPGMKKTTSSKSRPESPSADRASRQAKPTRTGRMFLMENYSRKCFQAAILTAPGCNSSRT
jgi:hypothetical protein